MFKFNQPAIFVFILLMSLGLLSACATQTQKQPAEVIPGYDRIIYPGELTLYYSSAEEEDDKPYKVIANNREFHIFGEAVKPSIQSMYLLENSVINEGDAVLDIGTGSGIQAVFAVEKASRIVATDIGEDAIKSAKENVKRFALEKKIDVRLGDLFEPVKEGEKFDVIINNINYPEDEENEADPLWQVHERFFRDVKQYLKQDGRIYYQSGFLFNIPRIQKMLKKNKLQIFEMKMITAVLHKKELILYVIKREAH